MNEFISNKEKGLVILFWMQLYAFRWPSKNHDVGSVLLIGWYWISNIELYDFRIKTIFGSTLSPVVCRRAINVICVCLRIVMFNTHCVVFLFCFVCLRLVYHVLTVSLDCPILINHSVFSNVYLEAFYWLVDLYIEFRISNLRYWISNDSYLGFVHSVSYISSVVLI